MNFYDDLSGLQQRLDVGEVQLKDRVKVYLHSIRAKKKLNAFLEVFEDEARARADEIQKKIDQGTAGVLAGMVIGIKDNIVYKGHRSSAASKMLSRFKSLFNATAIERLLKADAIIIGRLNCDEFAMGGSNENSAFGPVLNPLDHSRVSGGSSGGSAAAVAAGLCDAALGSDTGGSVRQPASFCGVYGLKPTYGRVSRHGLIAYASSFDQIGTLTTNYTDAALILSVIAGRDDFDSTSSSKAVPDYLRSVKKNKKLRLAVISETLNHEGLHAEVKAQISKTIQALKKKGHTVDEVHFPYLDQMVPTYYVLTTAEASSNLSRYDGIEYGYRSKNAEGIEQTFIKSRTEGFGKEVKRRIMLGTFVLSAGYYEAYFSKAQKVRRLIKQWTDQMLESYDLILSPTTPHPAFKLGALTQDPIAMYLEDIFTVHANLAGTPALSIPGLQTQKGLPFGLHALAASFDEEKLFEFAEIMKQLTPKHL